MTWLLDVALFVFGAFVGVAFAAYIVRVNLGG